jgi:hypothetical protein
MYTCYTTKYDTVEDGLTECASEGNPGGGGVRKLTCKSGYPGVLYVFELPKVIWVR